MHEAAPLFSAHYFARRLRRWPDFPQAGEAPAAGARPRSALWLTAGIAALTVYFFLTLGLLQQYDLSYLFPFQGVTVILISAGSYFLLKEKLTFQLVLGALLITAGVVLVSTT